MSIRPALLIVAAAAALLGSPSDASADPLAKPSDPEALKHLARGDAHYRIREFEAVVEEYRAGARIEASPRFLYNLAQSFRQLKDYENAIWHFTQWLKTANPPDDMRRSIEAVVQDLRVEQAKAPPPGEPDKDDRRPIEPAPAPRGPRWYADGLGWALTAGGVVSIGAGALLLQSASGLEDDADGPGLEEGERGDLRDRASTRRVLGYLAAAAGSGLVITGIVRLILTPDAEQPPAAAALEVTIGPRWLGVRGTF
jgi:tetratricopeptide (TPR) repeat protein